MNYSNINLIKSLQRWMDSVGGQTFLNYAYSWGASIVILGTLFKLTHLPGADLMLFLGMGTEVVVFFLSAFDRPFDKTKDGLELAGSRKVVTDNDPAEKMAEGVNPEAMEKYSSAVEELAALVKKERDAVEKMISQTSVCTEDMVSLSGNLRKIDSIASAVADAIGKKQ